MEQADLDPDERKARCIRFLKETPPLARPRPLVPAMREMFGISSLGVVEAIRASHEPDGGADATS